MSHHRQRRDLGPPDPAEELTTNADVLSESTDLGTLLSAILGESHSVSTSRPASDVIAAADEDPQAAVCADPSPPVVMDMAAIPRAWLTEAPSESGLKNVANSPATRSEDDDTSPTGDLASLRNRLRRGRAARSPHPESESLALHTTTRAIKPAAAESDRRAAPKLLVVVDEQSPRPRDAHGINQVSSGETQRGVDGLRHAMHSLSGIAAAVKDARRLSMIVVGVVVVVSVALLTGNAISRAFSPPASRPIPDSASGGREVATQAAALNNPAPGSSSSGRAGDAAVPNSPTLSSAPPASDDRRTRPGSGRAATRPSRRPVGSASLPSRTVDAASNEVASTAIRPETPSPSEAERPRSEPATAGSDTTVTSAPLTTIREPATSAGRAEIPAAPQTQAKPQPQPPTAAATSPLGSTAATTSRTPPRLIQGSTPEYPHALRAAKVRGLVEVQVTIDETGRVTRAAAVSGPAALREAAERAVRTWRYEPATVNGAHAPATTTVSFRFEPK